VLLQPLWCLLLLGSSNQQPVRVKKMSKENLALLKASGVALIVAAAVVWASNNIDVVEDTIG